MHNIPGIVSADMIACSVVAILWWFGGKCCY